MLRKRPCRVCRKWFRPDPRAGGRQKVCGSAECQAERVRRSCADWHRRNPDYDREDRLRRRLRVEPAEGHSSASGSDPLGEIDWSAARNAVGLEVSVLIEETGKVLCRRLRNAAGVEEPVPQGESGRLPPSAVRNDIGPARGRG